METCFHIVVIFTAFNACRNSEIPSASVREQRNPMPFSTLSNDTR